MKITDFLEMNNKPKLFKYKNYIWKLREGTNFYYNDEVGTDFENYLASVQICDLDRSFSDVLNDKIEIIEKPKLEKITLDNGFIIDCDETGRHFVSTNRKDRNVYIPKINQIIDMLERLNKEVDDSGN